MKVPPVMRAAWVRRPLDEAFAVFTGEIGAWWPLPTHGLFGDQSGGVAFRDGSLVEQSIDGTEVVWGEILAWEPPTRLVIAWHPGRESTDASEVEVVFEADGDGTRVMIEHRGWETFGTHAIERRRGYVGPGAWGSILDQYADGVEPRPDPVDLSELAAAYREFFAEAERGGFGPAPAGEWNAEQVVAHVALNDAAMVRVCQALVHQNATRFENQVCQDRAVLDRFIEVAGGLPGLIARGRHTADLVMASVARLSPDQQASEVHCRLTHDDEIMVDRPLSWHGVAVETQAGMHLPAHTEQLRNLRA